MAATHAVASLPDSAPIAAVIDALVSALGLSSVRNILARKETWATALEEQMVLTLGSLRRLSPQRIAKLGLPLLIEEELEKIIVHYAAREPLLSVTGVPVRASFSCHPVPFTSASSPDRMIVGRCIV